ncbi:sortase [Nostocoides sp. F2B08]|uniref:class F sortase n=1 Tax=Nostocoides sp. F2B08 TaxID=2653936 RepID=UPI001263E05B|nr:class F sortase [Tetrasphaera sp. F2B08]KAB7745148.1 sortase [Tetrasphaera sp. F2B08]
MNKRPLLLVGALVAIVGAALVLFWTQRGADAGSEVATAPETSVTSTGSPSATQSATPSTTAEPPQGNAPDPTGHVLSIPDIGLEADLHAEGLRDGKVNPPAGSVMWFTGFDRVAPGEVGTSVIAGHVVANGSPDRFAELAQVEVGDEVQVTTPDGEPATFTVVRAGVVDKDALTTDQAVWGANTSVRRLAIITCDDAFGFRDDGHRVANYVVIAEPA